MESERTRDDNADSRKKPENGESRKDCQVCALLLVGLTVMALIPLCGDGRYRLPLVTDEEMIAHFQTHREEFEEVARRHRSFPDRATEVGKNAPEDEEETKSLLERAALGLGSELPFMAGAMGDAYWLPDPYHPDSRRKVRELHAKCRAETERLHGANTCCAARSVLDCRFRNALRYQALAFNPSRKSGFPSKKDWLEFHVQDHYTVSKEYIHLPEAAKFDEYGRILVPFPDDPAKTARVYRTDSLNFGYLSKKPNDIPGLFYCRYRSLDDAGQWFLQMCVRSERDLGG